MNKGRQKNNVGTRARALRLTLHSVKHTDGIISKRENIGLRTGPVLWHRPQTKDTLLLPPGVENGSRGHD